MEPALREALRPPYAGVATPPRRKRLHLALLFLSFWSLALAGGVWWERAVTEPEVASYGALLRAAVSPEFHWRMVTSGWLYALAVLAILGAHEMGHYLACRHYRIPATLPFFIPGPPPIGSFGAVIRIRGPIPDRRALFDVAAAGPLAGFAVAVPVLAAGIATAAPAPPIATGEVAEAVGAPLAFTVVQLILGRTDGLVMNSLCAAGWVGMLVTSLNLFPVGQLDGGHAVYAMGRGLHRTLARMTLVALGAFIISELLSLELPAYIVWFVILLWMRDRHPRLLDERQGLGAARAGAALLLALLFVLSFIPVPLGVIEG